MATRLILSDRERVALDQTKILHALATWGPELTRGQITNYVLSGAPLARTTAALDGLLAEGHILERRAWGYGVHSRFYRLNPARPSTTMAVATGGGES